MVYLGLRIRAGGHLNECAVAAATPQNPICRHHQHHQQSELKEGVLAQTGCGMASEGEATDLLRRTIAGYARHANFFSAQLVGLGCEANQIGSLLSAQQLEEGAKLIAFTIQDTGGTQGSRMAGRLGWLLGLAHRETDAVATVAGSVNGERLRAERLAP